MDLTRTIELIGKEVDGVGPAKAAADAMADIMKEATARYIGGDLRMSGFAGAKATFEVTATPGVAKVVMAGGTYALADKGRKGGGRIFAKPKRRSGQRRAALDTPRGYRRSVRGSRWRGFDITNRHADKALAAGVEAAMVEIRKKAAG